MPISTTADFTGSRLRNAENSLLNERQAPRTDAGQQIDLFQTGVHEAVFTITSEGARKEHVEEVVLARHNHVRNGEELALVERDGAIVIHQQFHTLVSVQSLIAELHRRDITASIAFNWSEAA